MKLTVLFLLSAVCLAKGYVAKDNSEDLAREQEFRKNAAISEYLFQYIQNNNKSFLHGNFANAEEPSNLPPQITEIQQPTAKIDGVESLDNDAPQLPVNTEMFSDKKPLPPQYENSFWPPSLSNGNSIYRPRPPVQSNSAGAIQIVPAPVLNGPNPLIPNLINTLVPQNASNAFEVPALPLQSPNSTFNLPSSPPTSGPAATWELPSPPSPPIPPRPVTVLKLPAPPPPKPSNSSSSEALTLPASDISNRPVPPKSGIENLLAQLSPEVLEQLLAYVKNSRGN